MTETEKLEQEAYEQGVPVDYVKFRSEKLNGLFVERMFLSIALFAISSFIFRIK